MKIKKHIAEEIALSKENAHSSLLIDSKYNDLMFWCLCELFIFVIF